MSADIFDAINAADVERVREQLADDPRVASARTDSGLTAVLAALYGHRQEIVDVLLSAGPDLDVFEAAGVGDVDRLAQLLHADPAAARAYAPDGFFPLALAAYFDRPAAVGLLLGRGADVGATATNPMQVQALHAAVAGRSLGSVRSLVEAGADPNVHQHGGWTPLMGAAAHGDVEIVELLLSHGADPAATNDADRDAASLARENGHDALAERLAARARPQPASG